MLHRLLPKRLRDDALKIVSEEISTRQAAAERAGRLPWAISRDVTRDDLKLVRSFARQRLLKDNKRYGIPFSLLTVFINIAISWAVKKILNRIFNEGR